MEIAVVKKDKKENRNLSGDLGMCPMLGVG
jgi:hypothetical protein